VPPPEGYKAELPADLQLPDGIAFKIDETNPAFAKYRAWANAKGLGQPEFAEGLGILAEFMTQNDVAFAARAKAEIAKAGTNAGQRVDVVGKWLVGEVGEADATPIKATLVTDAHLRFYEKIMQKACDTGHRELLAVAPRGTRHAGHSRFRKDEFRATPSGTGPERRAASRLTEGT